MFYFSLSPSMLSWNSLLVLLLRLFTSSRSSVQKEAWTRLILGVCLSGQWTSFWVDSVKSYITIFLGHPLPPAPPPPSLDSILRNQILKPNHLLVDLMLSGPVTSAPFSILCFWSMFGPQRYLFCFWAWLNVFCVSLKIYIFQLLLVDIWKK